MHKNALISVSDKNGIVEFARQIKDAGYRLLSTGGTFKALQEAGLEPVQVSDYTGSPEIMDGRVKTLHPKIHGGILGRRDDENDIKQANEQGIEWIDIVVVNLYPFEQTVESGADEATVIENIDIGGPSMLRSAAKNHQFVTVVTHPEDYELVANELAKDGETTLETRKLLAYKTFQRTSEYDRSIAFYMSKVSNQPEPLILSYEKVKSLRYGENPHQKAAFFRNPDNHDSNITNAKQLGGKELSFNNYVDGDSAIELVKEFDRPTAVFIKHNNPCGIASSDTIEQAFKIGHQVDELSAFGCVIAVNREVTEEIVDYIKEKQMFVEIIIAPSFEAKALKRLLTRKNLRLLELGEMTRDEDRRDIKKVAGGILIQSADTTILTEKDLKVVTKEAPTKQEVDAMLFARKIVKHVTSNAVVFAKVDEQGDEFATGIGAGQMSRVDSVHIASHKGGDKVPGSVMASDAFFPFPDGVEGAHQAGVTAILQPGGSIRDDEVIKRADELGLSMVFTGIRSFKH